MQNTLKREITSKCGNRFSPSLLSSHSPLQARTTRQELLVKAPVIRNGDHGARIVVFSGLQTGTSSMQEEAGLHQEQGVEHNA